RPAPRSSPFPYTTLFRSISLLSGVLAVSSPALAHHGNAAYDGSVTMLKDATVTRMSWQNPHTIVLFDVKGDNGEPVHWSAELGKIGRASCRERGRSGRVR